MSSLIVSVPRIKYMWNIRSPLCLSLFYLVFLRANIHDNVSFFFCCTLSLIDLSTENLFFQSPSERLHCKLDLRITVLRRSVISSLVLIVPQGFWPLSELNKIFGFLPVTLMSHHFFSLLVNSTPVSLSYLA